MYFLYNNKAHSPAILPDHAPVYMRLPRKKLCSNALFYGIIGTRVSITNHSRPYSRFTCCDQVRRFLFYCCAWDLASSAAAASANVCMALL